MKLKSPAKLNLTLNITGKRSDGYHQIETIMQTISLADEVILTPSSGVAIQTNMPYIPNDDRNIAYRAAKLFFEKARISGGVDIKINKKIPVGAGMGGGSSNAATVLYGLNAMHKSPFSKSQLEEIGLKLGADVPYFFTKGCCLATGLGEALTPIKSTARAWVVIVKPPFSISTKWAYQKLNPLFFKKSDATDKMAHALQSGNINGIADNLYNIFELSTSLFYPQITNITNTLAKNGALGAAMTGSGSAVFGIFENTTAAQKCAAVVNKLYKTVFIAFFE